eukprot:CAMPEP_0196577176 /NCGR_PEP_ID=MMETSP1081-20130531/6288_1 /TAXON_ID=36882 /ORGANISM="Pyramimonas amylifera, Strain CCMP720" /LENGTH=74 /DNA_ID=CAMNT_0041896021 /DNA_START=39 /DNA_END=260 /DNA_ORIENTATION=-
MESEKGSKWQLKEEMDAEAKEAREAGIVAIRDMRAQLAKAMSASTPSSISTLVTRTRTFVTLTQMLMLVHLGDP